MSLETVTHINDLVPANPLGTDDRRTADDHIRNIKLALKNDLPLDAPASVVGMNMLKGATSEAIRSLLGASNTPFRNKIINGNFSVYQRNTGSIAFSSSIVYFVDRFYGYCSGAAVTAIVFPTRQSFKLIGNASNTNVTFGTRVLSINSADLALTNATLSCFLKCFTGTLTVNWSVFRSDGTDTFGTIGAPAKTSVASGAFIVTTTETRFSATISMPPEASNGLEVLFTIAGLSSGQELVVSNVQLEKGSIQSSDIVFEDVDSALQISRCNYFYQKFSGDEGVAVLGSGRQNSTTVSRLTIPISAMRKKPTVSFAGSVLLDIAGATTAATLSTQYNSLNSVAFDVTHAAVGAVGEAVMLQLPSGGGNYIEIDAELYA